MGIQFGIFDHIEIHGDRRTEEIYEERIALLKRAEEGGFSAFHLAEHHGYRYSSSPTATVFLAALARETERLKLIPTVVCLPLHWPVRIFEELAMVDALSHGRLEIGVGKGITPYEHLMFGHPPEEASARAKEILAMLIKGWETGIISSEGSEYYDFLEMQLPIKPQQTPYPPLWTAGNVETAGRGGHNFIFPTTISPEMRSRYDELRTESRKEDGHQNPHVSEPKIAECQGVVIADTDEEAEDIARRRWGTYKELLMRTHGLVPPHLQKEVPELDNPLAKAMLAADPVESKMLVAGTVEHVRDHYVERVQSGIPNYFILMLPFGDMTNEETERTLEGFINEVIPAVREAEAAVSSTAS
jgi:alkanesulfonate monooxygenase SsuD/methylene tetrahydromethanopterin reductase-like flavin-dependent oxidoreductase (luciferase family)